MSGAKFRKLAKPTQANDSCEVFTHYCLECDRNTGWDNGDFIECANCLADNDRGVN